MAGGCLTQSQCTQLLQVEVNQAASQEQGIYGEMYVLRVASAVLTVTARRYVWIV
jgi:hypothetical protein